MTLTELLVTSVLVGIVTLGLIAAEQAVRLSRNASLRDSQVSIQIQAIALSLSRDISLTVGDFSDAGIYLQYDVLGLLAFSCFRHAAGNVNSYSDDLWYCWQYDRRANVPFLQGATRFIYSCGDLVTIPATNSCLSLPADQYHTWDIKFTDLGITVMDTANVAIDPTGFNPPGYIRNQSINSIRLHLSTLYDISQPESPIENPRYTIDTWINPPGLSK